MSAPAPVAIDPPQLVEARNFRELAGIASHDGRSVRPGMIYRSATFAHLDGADWDSVQGLDIKLYCDLRGPAERARHTLRWPGDAVEVVPVQVLTDAQNMGAEAIAALVGDPSGETARAFMRTNYALMPQGFSGDFPAFAQRLLAGDYPVLIACAAGQDRTGFLCALVLAALDVPHDAIREDYMRSYPHFHVERTRATLAGAMAGAASGPGAAEPSDAVLEALRVHADYLDSAWSAIERDYGSIDQYLEEVGGLGRAERERLKDRLLA